MARSSLGSSFRWNRTPHLHCEALRMTQDLKDNQIAEGCQAKSGDSLAEIKKNLCRTGLTSTMNQSCPLPIVAAIII
jgi:hypothetical protein